MARSVSPVGFNPSQEMSRRTLELHYNLDLASPHVEFHAHPFYELYFFLEGDLEGYVVGGHSYQLRPGDILMMPPGVPHHPIFLPDAGPYRRYVLWLAAEQLDIMERIDPGLLEVFQRCQQDQTYHIRCTSHTVREQLETYLNNMWQEELGASPCKHACLCSLSLSFLVLLNRVIADEHAIPSPHYQSDTLLDKLIAYINENYASSISLCAVAELFYTSPSNIEQLFSKKLGKPFYLYVTECRIIHAQSLISGGMPLKEVAHACGYNDYSNFYRAFTREVGISPSKFRLMLTPAHFQSIHIDKDNE